MSRTLKIIFTVSIILNIVLITAAVGYVHKRMQYGYGADKYQELSEEGRTLIQENFKERRKTMRPVFNDVRKAKAEMEAVLSADIFDEQAYDAAAKNLLDVRDGMSRSMSENAKTFLKELSVEDRKAMAKQMTKRLSGHGGKGRDKGRMERFKERNSE
ncbi:MAG: periplasmic heavy metal sensor [Pseudomonadota bacterium]